MRIARIVHRGRVSYAAVESEVLTLVEDPFTTGAAQAPHAARIALDEVRLLAPVAPRTVVGMAHNTGPADRELPPQAFLKPTGSVIGPGEVVGVPAGVGRVDAEGELAVVLGRTARNLTADDALDAVLGYTVANDVTARDLQQTDPLWTSAPAPPTCRSPSTAGTSPPRRRRTSPGTSSRSSSTSRRSSPSSRATWC